MSPYITAVIAGPYHVVRSHHDGIDLGLWCRQSLAEWFDPDDLFTITRQGFDWYHQNFGVRYAFGKYDQLFVPEFNAGAMENAGAITFNESYVFRSKVTDARYERRAETILHEMAHMWFGDLVTMRWWDDLWLNESFATYISTLCQVNATRWPGAWTTFANVEKTWAYRQDQLPSTHPISTDAPDVQTAEVNFDGITYAKGASVLKQLGAYVGTDAFLAGVREYFVDHAYGNTTLADLLSALEKSSGRDLGEWSKAWLETAGINTIRPEFTLDEAGHYASFELVQTAPTEVAGSNVAAAAPARDRPLQRRDPRRRDVAHPHRAPRARCRRRAHQRRRADRPAAARPPPGQRRRPRLLQGAVGRAQPAHPDHRRHRPPRGVVAARAGLVGRVGHDPRR